MENYNIHYKGIIEYCDAYFSDKQVTFNIRVN